MLECRCRISPEYSMYKDPSIMRTPEIIRALVGEFLERRTAMSNHKDKEELFWVNYFLFFLRLPFILWGTGALSFIVGWTLSDFVERPVIQWIYSLGWNMLAEGTVVAMALVRARSVIGGAPYLKRRKAALLKRDGEGRKNS